MSDTKQDYNHAPKKRLTATEVVDKYVERKRVHDYYSLESCTPTPAAIPCTTPATKKKEDTMSRYYDEELDMYVDSASITDTERQRSYLRNRVDGFQFNKVKDLEKQFGLRGDESPETFEDAIARIKAGKYAVSDGFKVDKVTYNPLAYIVWKDPSLKEDRAGFKAAQAAYEKARTEAMDIIAIKDPAAALDAVKALESWTYTA